MRFFKVQGKRSTFPWAIVCCRDRVGGLGRGKPKVTGPDLECCTQIDMHKRKGGLNFQCSKEVSYVFKNISSLFVPLSSIDYLCLLDTECKAVLKLEVWELVFPSSKQFLVDTCWVLFNPFSSDAIQLGATSVICGLRPVFWGCTLPDWNPCFWLPFYKSPFHNFSPWFD